MGDLDLVTAPIAEQVAAFTRIVMGNPIVATLVERLPQLGLPGWYVAAGALCQTVWNAMCGRAPGTGIRDYDVAYFDDADLAEAAERATSRRVAELVADLHIAVDVRNEARVHLWYEAKFGVPCPPYTSTEAAIATFPSTGSAVGIRIRDGALDVYAPYGFSDLFSLRARPNPLLAPREVYEAKTVRWRKQWPQLEVLPWAAAAR
jgi:hypothetical protein